ncbi:MAG TPA: hypothetical protein VFM88_09025 [Vicinamibacteria bacterium]|nr:hypothetical protein [Vicinamibacteria bacterium]
MKRPLLAVALFLPALLAQLSRDAPRLDADAVEYYAHLRSLYHDRDLDFANEFEHFGILTRGDKTNPTPTGHRRTIFSVGPALLWLPFYAAGDVAARAVGDAQDGYSPWYVRAVCVGSLVYIVIGLLLVHALLAPLFPDTATPTVLLLLYATMLWWYATVEPVMSHPGSFFLAALALSLFWPAREALSLRRGLLLGFVIGVAATVRWQSAVLLLLPALGLAPRLRRAPAATVRTGLATLAAFAVGALPQMLAWNAIFGQYLLADPPHGRDFLRLDHPYLLQTFFSSRHGLLYWTPVLWAGFLGLLAYLRRDFRGALLLLVPVAAMSYVNACSGDWWAGGSYSNRRFDSLLPFLAVGMAHAISQAFAAARRRPDLALAGFGGALALWNVLLMAQYKQVRLPLDDTVSFARVVENAAAIVQGATGTPLAWPANWLFAARHGLGAGRYDLMVGKYLFYRQQNLGGVIDLGDPRADPALVGPGWGGLRNCESVQCRAVVTRARLLAPLDVPEPLEVAVRARGEGVLELAVNGVGVAAWPLRERLSESLVRVPRERFRRELNDLSFTVSGSADVDRVRFTRLP